MLGSRFRIQLSARCSSLALDVRFVDNGLCDKIMTGSQQSYRLCACVYVCVCVCNFMLPKTLKN